MLFFFTFIMTQQTFYLYATHFRVHIQRMQKHKYNKKQTFVNIVNRVSLFFKTVQCQNSLIKNVVRNHEIFALHVVFFFSNKYNIFSVCIVIKYYHERNIISHKINYVRNKRYLRKYCGGRLIQKSI